LTLVADYCGYCGTDFEREADEAPEICQECKADSVVFAQYVEDNEYVSAEEEHERYQQNVEQHKES
jgi:hypothetical protein